MTRSNASRRRKSTTTTTEADAKHAAYERSVLTTPPPNDEAGNDGGYYDSHDSSSDGVDGRSDCGRGASDGGTGTPDAPKPSTIPDVAATGGDAAGAANDGDDAEASADAPVPSAEILAAVASITPAVEATDGPVWAEVAAKPPAKPRDNAGRVSSRPGRTPPGRQPSPAPGDNAGGGEERPVGVHPDDGVGGRDQVRPAAQRLSREELARQLAEWDREGGPHVGPAKTAVPVPPPDDRRPGEQRGQLQQRQPAEQRRGDDGGLSSVRPHGPSREQSRGRLQQDAQGAGRGGEPHCPARDHNGVQRERSRGRGDYQRTYQDWVARERSRGREATELNHSPFDRTPRSDRSRSRSGDRARRHADGPRPPPPQGDQFKPPFDYERGEHCEVQAYFRSPPPGPEGDVRIPIQTGPPLAYVKAADKARPVNTTTGHSANVLGKGWTLEAFNGTTVKHVGAEQVDAIALTAFVNYEEGRFLSQPTAAGTRTVFFPSSRSPSDVLEMVAPTCVQLALALGYLIHDVVQPAAPSELYRYRVTLQHKLGDRGQTTEWPLTASTPAGAFQFAPQSLPVISYFLDSPAGERKYNIAPIQALVTIRVISNPDPRQVQLDQGQRAEMTRRYPKRWLGQNGWETFVRMANGGEKAIGLHSRVFLPDLRPRKAPTPNNPNGNMGPSSLPAQ